MCRDGNLERQEIKELCALGLIAGLGLVIARVKTMRNYVLLDL